MYFTITDQTTLSKGGQRRKGGSNLHDVIYECPLIRLQTCCSLFSYVEIKSLIEEVYAKSQSYFEQLRKMTS